MKENRRGDNCGEEGREVLVVSIDTSEALSAGSKTIAGCNISELDEFVAGF